MNDEPNFGLSADRIRQLLECKPSVGTTRQKPSPKVLVPSSKAVKQKPAIKDIVANIGLTREQVQALLPKVTIASEPAKPEPVKERKPQRHSYAYQRAHDPRFAGMTDKQIKAYRQKLYNEKHREKLKAYHKEWTKANRDKVLEAAKRYYQKNKDRINARLRQWYKKNPDKVRAIKRRYLILRKFRDLA
jgi:ABC-type sulfate/molybdate transport systems ATPase subunit